MALLAMAFLGWPLVMAAPSYGGGGPKPDQIRTSASSDYDQ